MSTHLTNNRNAMDTIDKASKDVAKLSKERQEIKEIADVASGAMGDKTSFETFIQSLYFERVLHLANLRMRKMTSGRYELIPREATKTERRGRPKRCPEENPSWRRCHWHWGCPI